MADGDFLEILDAPQHTALADRARFTRRCRCSTYSLILRIVRVASVSMGQGLGLAAISEARASACVSIYSRMFVTLPF
jgi:hypothetical protein